jgi:tRNA (guanine10-N2)-dimethyltransferase
MAPEQHGKVVEWLARGVHDSWPDVRVNLDEPRLILYAYHDHGRMLLAAAPPPVRRRGWANRRARRRPYFHPVALYPKFARTLVNLTQVPEGGLLLDPFCGTGSILIEAATIGVLPVGIDIARRMCLGTRANLDFLGIENSLGIVQADVRMPPVRAAHAIATDVPYGRDASTWGAAPQELVRRVLAYAVEVLTPGRRAVVMHSLPQVEAPAGLRLTERHILPVHRSLTRRIDVYVRE